jgi:uncharacterized protein YcaQ
MIRARPRASALSHPPSIDLDQLRRYTIARTLFPPTTLARAIGKMGFVQADPIRAPARAQDLTLRHRVRGYAAGDLERRYPSLDIEEDFFINYGFLPRSQHRRLRPRPLRGVWDASDRRRVRALLAFVGEQGTVHPRHVEAHFAHGQVTNYWGGVSSATTHLLDAMHYRGLLRIARRERGVRLYALAASGGVDEAPAPRAADRRTRVDALVDLVVQLYAPLPAASLAPLIWRLRHAVPQWKAALRPAVVRARRRLSSFDAAGSTWYYPPTENPWSTRHHADDRVRLLAPFDPLVWDRRRFERLWGWSYRFEAYTPAAKRKFGYYALPLLFRDQVAGWANVTVINGVMTCALGFAAARPSEPAFDPALVEELASLRRFLGRDEPAG